MNKRTCPDCHDPMADYYTRTTLDKVVGITPELREVLWCEHCMFEYYDCGTCGKVFGDESDAADCEYEHRTVLDDIVDALN